MYLNLYSVKKHLNIDEDFNDDDEYLVDLISVATQVVEKHIDNNLDEIAASNGGELPSPILHAMLLLIADLYSNRETVAYTSISKLPLSYDYLLDLYKNYDGKTKEK